MLLEIWKPDYQMFFALENKAEEANQVNVHPSAAFSSPPPNANVVPYKHNIFNNKKVRHNGVRYKECLQNHAAAIGGTATNGCGEFMPNGEEGTIEALKGLNCSACNYHINFHRKKVEGEQQQQLSSWDHNFHYTINMAIGIGSRKFLLNHGGGGGYHKSLLALPQYPHRYQMIMSNYNMGMRMVEIMSNYNMGMRMMGSILSDQSDEQEDHCRHGGGSRIDTGVWKSQALLIFNFICLNQ
ncbi:hypothetical protein C1H46_016855 [Malus baccata]|uniref:ZF-HD dimerization-type domain-containing protein n=1 Tax=Malus baccata TaxID=106549 RepID=A0A540MFI0_MALBA|nr:hypothetical protein C1H46_016855 [Malus baccata]